MKISARNLAGASDRKRDTDFYPTPEWATQALIDKEKFEGSIWECASGDGKMAKVLEANKFEVYSSEIRKDESVYGDKEVNFLNTIKKVDNIITNPPFMFAKEFVEHAKKCATKKIAMFLKLVFLEGISRYSFFKDEEFPLKKVYVFCKRVNLYKNGAEGENSGTIAFAWFIWDKTYDGEPMLDWIKGSREELSMFDKEGDK